MLILLSLTVALWAPPNTPTAPVGPTLEALLAHAEAHAPEMAVALIERARASTAIRAASPWMPADPEVELGAGLRRKSTGSGVDFEVRLAQPLDLSGERGLRLDAARAERVHAEADIAEARRILRGAVRGAVIESWLMAEQADWARSAAALADRLAETAARRVDAGAAPAADRILAEIEQRAARARVLDAEQRAAAIRATLAARIRWPDADLPPIAGALPPIEAPPPLDALRGALAEHPRMRQAEARLAAAGADLAAVTRSAWPDPTLALGYARESSAGPEPAADIWSAGIGFPLPVWRGADAEIARGRINIRGAEARRAAAQAELEAALTERWAAVDRAAQRVAVLEDGLLPLKAHAERVQTAYGRGEVDLTRLLQIRRVQSEAEVRALNARAEYHRAAARLVALLGPSEPTRPIPSPEAPE